jgi:transposase-like protein
MTHDPEDRTPEDVRAEIAQTRAQLGDTVEALAAKTDVKGQAKRAVSDARATVSDRAGDAREAVAGKTNEALSAAQQATPDSAADAAHRFARLVQEHRARLIPAGALALGVIIGRRRAR